MRVRLLIVMVSLAVVGAACSSSGSKGAQPPASSGTTHGSSTSSTPSTLASGPQFTILVTNDDGYNAPGIDTMVEALRKLPNVDVVVVAPMANQSGTDGKTTNGTLQAQKLKTASGYPATAVDGYPADTIRYAITTVLTSPPNVVVSGINNGQNVGPFIAISGTVGAAEAAANVGVPAIAVSQGFGNPPDFASAARIVVDWITAHRASYTGAAATAGDVVNINVPTCTAGSVRGLRQVPAATSLDGRDINKVDCTSKAAAPADDVAAFTDGFASVTDLDIKGKTVTSTTVYNGSA